MLRNTISRRRIEWEGEWELDGQRMGNTTLKKEEDRWGSMSWMDEGWEILSTKKKNMGRRVRVGWMEDGKYYL